MQRIASGRMIDYVLTLRPEGVEMRPKRSRRGDAVMSVTWDQVYINAVLARPVKRKRRVRRGVLTLGR
jgi:hypothetical protein